MPMLKWNPGGPPRGTAIEVRVANQTYSVTDGIPFYVDPQRVAAVTAALVAAVSTSTVTTPPAAQ